MAGRQEARLASRLRSRAPGAGAKYRLVFVDRLQATLVHLRHATTHDVLAAWFGGDRSTITRAVNEIRPLLAERGRRVEDGRRLRPLPRRSSTSTVAETTALSTRPRSGCAAPRQAPPIAIGSCRARAGKRRQGHDRHR